MSGNNFHDQKPNKCFWRDLPDCKISRHLIDPIINCEVCAALKAFDLAFHVPSILALGCFEGRTIDLELAFAFEIDFIVALLFIWVVVWVAGRSAW